MHSPFAIRSKNPGLANIPIVRVIIKAVAERFLYFDFVDSVDVEVSSAAPKHSVALASNQDKNAIVQAFGKDEFSFRAGSHHDRMMEDFISRKTLIIDAGANVGATSVLFAMRYSEALIVSIEPESGNFAKLCKNTAAFSNVICMQAALSDEPNKTVSIELPDGLGNDSFRVVEPQSANASRSVVTTTTISDIVATYPDRVPFILKIDVEGYESKIFAGDHSVGIDAFPFIFVEPHDWMLSGQGTIIPYLEFITKTSRDVVIVGDKIAAVSCLATTAAAHA